jgi:hypothetical protein
MFCLFKLLEIFAACLYFSHHEIKSLQVTGLYKNEASSAFVKEATHHTGSPKFSLIGPARLFLFLAHYIAQKWSTIASVESGYSALKSPALMDGSVWIFRKSKTDEERGAPLFRIQK